MSEQAIEQVKRLALHLSRAERTQLAAWLQSAVEASTGTPTPVAAPTRSLYGLWADLESDPTDVAAIDEVRREMWRTFPREDIA